MFERLGKLKKKLSGYILSGPNQGFWKNKKDFTVNNKSFKENQSVLYIGVKNDMYEFDINNLDCDSSMNHDN